MKSVLISIQPKWCELIANGKKTVEVRKTKPKLDVPFKCYIYCTKGGKGEQMCFGKYTCRIGNGKVIGEFVCDRIDEIGKRGIYNNFDYCYLSLNEWGNDDIEIEITDIKKSCISKEELNLYGENSFCLYAWHISNLVIYDEPKELYEFLNYNKYQVCKEKDCFSDDCWICPNNAILTKPPQSYCYIDVEKLGV